MTENFHRLLTTKMVCGRYCVSRSTVGKERRSGHLKSINFGRSVRYRIEDVEAWVSSRLV